MISIRYSVLAFCLVCGQSLYAQNAPSTTPASGSTPTGTLPTSSSSTTSSTPPSASDEALRAAQTIQTTPSNNGSQTTINPATGAVTPGTPFTGVNPNGESKTTTVQSYGEKDTFCKKTLRNDFQFESKVEEINAAENKLAKKNSSPELEKKRVEFLKEKIRKDPSNILLIVRLAKEFFDQGEYDKTALLLWKQIDKIEIKDMVLLAQSHERLKQRIELRKISEIIIGKDEKNGLARFYLAKSFDPKIEKERELYKSNLVKALELDPKNRAAIFALADHYLNQNNVFEVKTLYADSLKILKNDPELTSKLCEAVSLDSAHNETKTFCRDAIRLSPSIAENYVYLGISHKEQANWDEAHKLFQTAAEKFPDSEFALICLAESQAQKNDYIGSFSSYRAASEVDPNSERALLGYAKSAFAIKKISESLESFKKLCKKNRKYSADLKKVILELSKSAQKREVADFQAELRRCGGFF